MAKTGLSDLVNAALKNRDDIKRRDPLKNNFINNDNGLRTGILSLDYTLWGGIPNGRVAYFYGPESAGKTTLLLILLAMANRDGRPVIFGDHECAVDFKYAEKIGVNISNPDLFIYLEPKTAEAAFDVFKSVLSNTFTNIVCYCSCKKAETFEKVCPYYSEAIQSGIGDENSHPCPCYAVSKTKPCKHLVVKEEGSKTPIFVTDSVAAMIPKEQWDDMNRMAPLARFLSQRAKEIKMGVGLTNSIWLCTNQLRLNPGAMYGNPEYEPGGKTFGFLPDLKIRVGKSGKAAKNLTNHPLQQSKFKITKSKHCMPNLEAPFPISLGYGIDKPLDTINYLKLSNQGRPYGMDIETTKKGEIKYGKLILDKDLGDFPQGEYSLEDRDIIDALDEGGKLRIACETQLTTGRIFESVDVGVLGEVDESQDGSSNTEENEE